MSSYGDAGACISTRTRTNKNQETRQPGTTPPLAHTTLPFGVESCSVNTNKSPLGKTQPHGRPCFPLGWRNNNRYFTQAWRIQHLSIGKKANLNTAKRKYHTKSTSCTLQLGQHASIDGFGWNKNSRLWSGFIIYVECTYSNVWGKSPKWLDRGGMGRGWIQHKIMCVGYELAAALCELLLLSQKQSKLFKIQLILIYQVSANVEIYCNCSFE